MTLLAFPRYPGEVSPTLAQTLAQWTVGRSREHARHWFSEQLTLALEPGEHASVASGFAAAGRRLGALPVELDASERALYAPAHGWPLACLGRVALLLTADSAVSQQGTSELVGDLYYRGDGDEKVAVLRALPLLVDPARYTELAVEACRTNVTHVFEAIACVNGYPREHFPELHFNQMVMKALFLGVSVKRIVGVEQRLTSELGRMLVDYRAEREAAGRSVPGDLGWLLSQLGET